MKRTVSKGMSQSTSIESQHHPAAVDYFATTHWTVVVKAGQEQSNQAQVALEELCRIYWYPLYVFARRQGAPHAEAEDLVQGFFASFLRKNHLATLRKEHGRFRAFLLACLKHYLANERDRSRSKKRGGGIEHVPIEWGSADEKYRSELAHASGTPDRSFDRAWITTLLERVFTRLAQEKGATGDGLLFETLRPFLMVSEDEITYGQAAARLNMSQGAVRVATCRLRRRYQELLRAEIASTCGQEHLEEEIRGLFQAFSD
jgi:RNA polymerase sigma-70 factor (ECF subfamily)